MINIVIIKTLYSPDRKKHAVIQILTENNIDTLQVHCMTDMGNNRMERVIGLASTLEQANYIAKEFTYGVL